MNLGLNLNTSSAENNESNSMFWSPGHLRITPRVGGMEHEESPRFFTTPKFSPTGNAVSPWASTTPQHSRGKSGPNGSQGALTMPAVPQHMRNDSLKSTSSPLSLALSPAPNELKGFDPDMFFSSPRHQASPMTKNFTAPVIMSQTPTNVGQQQQQQAMMGTPTQRGSFFSRMQAAPSPLQEHQRQQRQSQMQQQQRLMMQEEQLRQHMQQRGSHMQQRGSHSRGAMLNFKQGSVRNGSAFGFGNNLIGGLVQQQNQQQGPMMMARAVPMSQPNGMFNGVHVMQAKATSFFEDADVAVVAEKRGSSCHQCKRKQPHSKLVFCTNSFDKKHSPDKRLCRKKYCYNCLAKFYQMANEAELSSPTWQCPSCQLLCTCAACVRKGPSRGSASVVSEYDHSTVHTPVAHDVDMMDVGQ